MHAYIHTHIKKITYIYIYMQKTILVINPSKLIKKQILKFNKKTFVSEVYI